ncbi:pyrroloquinoline quinone biosynthesis peptide chaperone PqqD [Bradyrhizobium sp.]|uniref:pyrroloquinoline quinone biosynthesis peptide chaperone PqqD n=1 Tax=Bradyrhizobium sp. TaxID=376 RepID=UPI00403830C2
MSEVTRPSLTDIVELHPMYFLRWEDSEQAHVLLYPEGIVKLNSSAAEILKRVVGGRRIDEVVAELTALCDGQDVSADILEFLEIANDKGWTRVKA